jgi:GT2 family glycosyltransferase
MLRALENPAPSPDLAYSLVIPTFQRPDALEETLRAIAGQTLAPAAVIVVDSSPDDRTRELAARSGIRYERATAPSAALQRNQGAALVQTPIIGFMDDDITLQAETCARIVRVFSEDTEGKIGGIAARLSDMDRPVPSRLTRRYLRWQAGYDHPSYGGRLFGPAINCLPCYAETSEDLIPADWLNSGCVFYRTELFNRERFPSFEGYSFMEDVHLSARIGRSHRLFFHRTAACLHRDGAAAGRPAAEILRIARMRLRNQRLVARDVMGLKGAPLELRLFAHRLFATIAILRRRDRHWQEELLGTWS